MRTCHRPCPPRRLRSQRCMRSSRRLDTNSQKSVHLPKKGLIDSTFRKCARVRPLPRGETIEARVEVRNLLRSDELVLAGRARYAGVVVARSLARGARRHCTRTGARQTSGAAGPRQRRSDTSSDSARTARRAGTHTCDYIHRNQQRARPQRRHRQQGAKLKRRAFVTAHWVRAKGKGGGRFVAPLRVMEYFAV